MIKVGFKGTQLGLTVRQADSLAIELSRILEQEPENPPAQFHVGSNPVADEQAARIAHAAGYEIVRYPGERCPDIDLVRAVDVLIAVPSRYSWETIRYAGVMNKVITLLQSDGEHIPSTIQTPKPYLVS